MDKVIKISLSGALVWEVCLFYLIHLISARQALKGQPLGEFLQGNIWMTCFIVTDLRQHTPWLNTNTDICSDAQLPNPTAGASNSSQSDFLLSTATQWQYIEVSCFFLHIWPFDSITWVKQVKQKKALSPKQHTYLQESLRVMWSVRLREDWETQTEKKRKMKQKK